jgi:hypothetical protein
MQTPQRITLEGFYTGRRDYLRDLTQSSPFTGKVVCRWCGVQIKMAPVTVEIHGPSGDGCVGEGEEFEAGVPYCPRCEELPESRGCVHV